MKTKAALLAALAALAANAVQMATENWVSNRLTEATAPIRESVAALISATQTLQSAVGSLAGNVYTKQETDDRIVELAPAPGNYEMVSNRAMSAIQAHQTLQPATNYTDRATNEVLKSAIRADAAALSAFASTGAVARASVYGTPTRWTDASGDVWEELDVWSGDNVSLIRYAANQWRSKDDDSWMSFNNGTWTAGIDARADVFSCTGHEDDTSLTMQSDYGTITLTRGIATNLVGRVALTNDIAEAISTNNEAFVSAVLAVPIAGADAGDLAELSEYGSYGTVGAAILALIAGLAALKRRMGTADVAIAQKANASDLPYAMVTPGEWEFSGVPSDVTDVSLSWDGTVWSYTYVIGTDTYTNVILRPITEPPYDGNELSLTFTISSSTVTATRPSLPGHLLDRAVNAVSVSGDTTLTLPALVNAGKARDFLVRLEISGSTVPTITFQGQGREGPDGADEITYETDGDEFPVPDEAGTWSYSFTEDCVAHTFAVSLKKVNTVAQGGS